MNGYTMETALDTSANGQVARDQKLLTSLVGEGGGNVATQYDRALCASIGTLAAAKRSCAVGLAYSDLNTAIGGGTTARGELVKARAQVGTEAANIPLGRPDGFGLDGAMPGDTESYAGRVLPRHTGLTAPTTASGVNDWNSSYANNTPLAYGGANFSRAAYGAKTNGAALTDAINQSTRTATNSLPNLNLVPISGVNASFPKRTANMNYTKARFPYTVMVPDYATLHGGTSHFTSVSSALTTYRTNLLASGATPLHEVLQLAGAMKFQADTSAIVTTRVKRSGQQGSCTK